MTNTIISGNRGDKHVVSATPFVKFTKTVPSATPTITVITSDIENISLPACQGSPKTFSGDTGIIAYVI